MHIKEKHIVQVEYKMFYYFILKGGMSVENNMYY